MNGILLELYHSAPDNSFHENRLNQHVMYFMKDFSDGRLLPRFRRGLLREVPPQDDGLPVGLFVEALVDVVGHLSDSTVDFATLTHFNTFTTVRCPSFCVRLLCSAVIIAAETET